MDMGRVSNNRFVCFSPGVSVEGASNYCQGSESEGLYTQGHTALTSCPILRSKKNKNRNLDMTSAWI